MPKFSASSISILNTCHPDLQKICNFVVKYFDVKIIEGERSQQTQIAYFKAGKSKLDGVTQKSKHQNSPSLAVDLYPYPVDLSNKQKSIVRFYVLSGFMMTAAAILFDRGEITHKLRWGGDWDGDFDYSDNSFDDLGHFELI